MSGWLNIPVYGALVRLITPVSESEKVEDAEARLQGFARQFVPILDEYIPGLEVKLSSSTRTNR
jgi:hypothetical protein